MKISQTNDSLTIKTNGFAQLVIGAVFFFGGVVVSALILSGVLESNGEKLPAWLSFVILVFAVIGFFLARSAQNRTITLQKNGKSSITSKKLVGSGTAAQNFSTDEIAAVKLSTYMDNSTDSDGKQINRRRSELSLLMRNNDSIQIADEASKSGSFSFNGIDLSTLISKAPLGKEAKQIADFLGVEMQAVDMSNPATVIRSMVDAVKTGMTPGQPPTTVSGTFPPAPLPGNNVPPQTSDNSDQQPLNR